MTHVIAAAIGNKSGEVGLAWIDLGNPILHLCQVRDGKLYEATRATLVGCKACEVIFPATHVQSALYEALVRDNASLWHVETRPRRVFSEDHGLDKIRALSSVDLDLRELDRRYLCRGAAAALLGFVELTQDARFAEGSLRVRIDDDDRSRMTLDNVTVSILELLEDRRAVLSQHRQPAASRKAVVDFLDFTVTAPGARRLRAELVAPPCEHAVVTGRQGLVQELLDASSLRDLVTHHLAGLHDMDQLTSHYAARPKQFTLVTLKREADNTIRLLENLRGLLALEADLADRLASRLGKTLIASITKTRPLLMDLEQALTKRLQAGVSFQRSPEEQRIEVVYCVVTGLDGVLDVARQTYAEKIAQMKQYVTQLNTQHEDLEACLWFSVKRGYHLRVPREHATPARLGSLLIRPAFHKKTVDCTTKELASLNLKQEQATREALRRTELHLEDLRSNVKTALPALYAIAEAVALLDVLQGFANMAAETEVVRPVIYALNAQDPDPDLTIDQGRHLLVEATLERQREARKARASETLVSEIVPTTNAATNAAAAAAAAAAVAAEVDVFVPNDLRLQKMALVTGPNSAGKSTLLKQTALIVIMAQAGAWVPARAARIPLVERILTRIGTEDNLEANASTFSLEMTELAHILRTSPRTMSDRAENGTCQLVLIDELGRGTSSREGLALAWAASEFLLQRPRTLTIFATHFRQLEVLPGVQVLRFSVGIDEVTQALVLSHLVHTSQDASHSRASSAAHVSASTPEIPCDYGIRLAEACGFPQATIADARIVRERLLEHRVSLEAKRAGLEVLLRNAQTMTLPDLRAALIRLQTRHQTLPVVTDSH
ncbi:DNA mismatch repair protein MSH4 [Hondaea fermentalgiana]|uniref:DNA mismatch repair protein MSH4 n=1 Tax=Hondaea fermentalgiana TaxID=2315210 RepID=A0A2R5GPL3_9STRA|nr:DNA mismatch repair protein MSH4 [Hondaea fermentalgiana]|eukprot:GBG32807.1 DNA mismatch repair protein MSH4 [Hondaea fermentalgiana]